MGLPANGNAQGFMPAGSGQMDSPEDTAPSNGEVRLHASEPRQSEPEPAQEPPAPAPARETGPSAEQKHAAAEARRAAARQRAEVQKLEKAVTDLQHEMDDWHAQAIKHLEDGGATLSAGTAAGSPDGDGSGDPRLKAYNENIPVSPTPDANGDAATTGSGSAARHLMDRAFPPSPEPSTPAPPTPDAPTTGGGGADGATDAIRRYQHDSGVAPWNFIQNNRNGMDAVTGGAEMIQEGDAPTP